MNHTPVKNTFAAGRLSSRHPHRKAVSSLLMAACICAASAFSCPAASNVGPAFDPMLQSGISETPSFRTESFALPETARLLVVTEGTVGSECRVYVYEKPDPSMDWELLFRVPGILGTNGLSANRTAGDRTTPIGVFRMNTPFGQAPAVSGFPADYCQVDRDHVWSDYTNRLESDSTGTVPGERVGTERYAKYYDYAIDMGYNPYAIPYKGSALFLHCAANGDPSTAGCVAIDPVSMQTILTKYGSYGSGACFIALAPYGGFRNLYHSFGTNNGLSPKR